MLFNVLNIIRRLLVNVVVDPVAIEEIGMGTPGDEGFLVRVVVIIIVLWQIDIITLAHVTLVLLVEGVRRILQVTGDEELTAATSHHDADTALRRLGEDIQARHLLDVLTAHLGMAALRHIEDIIEATEDRLRWVERLLLEDAKHLLLERILRHTVEMIQSCLRTPTDIERGGDVRASPVEDLHDLRPILHILVLHRLDRSTRHNHAVKLLLGEFGEILVEHHHVLYRRILRGVALQLHKIHLQLQRGIGEKTHQVGLGGYLEGHQVEHDDFQWSNLLAVRPTLVHHEDVLMLE